MTACLTRLLQAEGNKVAILSRGYGGREPGGHPPLRRPEHICQPPAVGEEAYWLAHALPGAESTPGPPVTRRAKWPLGPVKPDLFLLDDGFQHFQLHRDLDMVLLDAAAPFGNGHLLPRGPLREPKSALTAAQVLILTRFQAGHDQPTLTDLQAAYPEKPVLTAAIEPSAARLFPAGRLEPPAASGPAPAGLRRPGPAPGLPADPGRLGRPALRDSDLSGPPPLLPGGITGAGARSPGRRGRGPGHHRQGLGPPQGNLERGPAPLGRGRGGPNRPAGTHLGVSINRFHAIITGSTGFPACGFSIIN